jgi:spore germination cell wall hydrolase CwlJ-like protein
MDPTLQQHSDITFLALTIWREARGEGHTCKVGVACSILNRVKNPKWWGDSVSAVLFKKWQYSSLTDPKDRQLTTWPSVADVRWEECLQIATAALAGTLVNPVAGADSYYDVSISAPRWAKPEMFVAQLDRIRFFNTDNDHELDETHVAPTT